MVKLGMLQWTKLVESWLRIDQEMVHCTGPTLLSHPSQKPIVVFCAEGVEPRLLSEDESLLIGSLSIVH